LASAGTLVGKLWSTLSGPGLILAGLFSLLNTAGESNPDKDFLQRKASLVTDNSGRARLRLSVWPLIVVRIKVANDQCRSGLGGAVHEEIGTTAGAIWQALDAKGELSLPSLKQQVGAKSPIFDWALGWLAREDKIIIAGHQKSYRVRLNDSQVRSAGV
jgi:winged helix-turn-helix protein DUF2582